MSQRRGLPVREWSVQRASGRSVAGVLERSQEKNVARLELQRGEACERKLTK